jgi:hypothetical protein
LRAGKISERIWSITFIALIKYYGIMIATAGQGKRKEPFPLNMSDSVLEETWGTIYIGAPLLKERAL